MSPPITWQIIWEGKFIVKENLTGFIVNVLNYNKLDWRIDMAVLTENEINEFAASILDPEKGVPGIVDPNTAYDWCKNAEIVIEQNAIEMGEDTSPDAVRKYVKNEMRKKIQDLGRFSPGEMAIFWVNEHEGIHPSQISTQDVFAQKFGLSSPSPIAGGLKRSMMFGDVVRDQFVRLFKNRGFQSTPKAKKNTGLLRDKIIDVFNNPIPNLPWLKPGKVEFLEDVTGETWAVFFKIPPNEESIKQIVKEIPEHYYAEMAQTLVAMDEVGINVDRVVFAPFNIADMKFGYTENKQGKHPLFKSSVSEVEISNEMKNKIKEIGNKMYHDHLMKVSMPPWNIPGEYTHIEPHTIEGSVMKDFGRYTLLNTIKNLANKEAEKIKKGLVNILPTKFGVSEDYEGKIGAGGYINYSKSQKRTVQTVDAAEFLIQEKGIKRQDLSSEILDEDKIREMFKTLGMEEQFEDMFVTKKESVTVTIPKNSEFKAIADDLSSELISESDGIFQQISGIDISDREDKIAKSESLNIDKENNISDEEKRERALNSGSNFELS